MTKGELREALEHCCDGDDDAQVLMLCNGKRLGIVQVELIGGRGQYAVLLRAE